MCIRDRVEVNAPLISFVNLLEKDALVDEKAPLTSFVNLLLNDALSDSKDVIFVAKELLSLVNAPLISVAI